MKSRVIFWLDINNCAIECSNLVVFCTMSQSTQHKTHHSKELFVMHGRQQKTMDAI